MNQEEQEREFLDNIRSTLDRSAADLDPRTLARLREGRRHALAQGSRQRPGLWHWLRLPAAAFAVSMALMAVFLYLREPAVQPYNGIEDLDIITSNENLDMLIDLEFYVWLAEEEEHAG